MQASDLRLRRSQVVRVVTGVPVSTDRYSRLLDLVLTDSRQSLHQTSFRQAPPLVQGVSMSAEGWRDQRLPAWQACPGLTSQGRKMLR